MTPNPLKAAEKESRMQEAITAICESKYNCPQAAQAFNIPCQSLYDHFSKKISQYVTRREAAFQSYRRKRVSVMDYMPHYY